MKNQIGITLAGIGVLVYLLSLTVINGMEVYYYHKVETQYDEMFNGKPCEETDKLPLPK